MQYASTLELVCKSGHRSDHLLDRVLRHNDAWCPKCGCDLKFTPAEAENSAEASIPPADREEKRALQGVAN